MDAAIIASAAALGLASAPHCTVMCSAPCAAALGRGGTGAGIAFHSARIAAYAAAGASAAAGVSALASWSQLSPALRPLWAMVQALMLALGLWLLIKARQPEWMAHAGRGPAPVPVGWQRLGGPARAAAAGGLWVGWPCGMLQSALVVAALASSAPAGAAAMAAFAVASAPGLVFARWAWSWLRRRGADARVERLGLRAAGAVLAAMSAAALGHGVWGQVLAYCARP